MSEYDAIEVKLRKIVEDLKDIWSEFNTLKNESTGGGRKRGRNGGEDWTCEGRIWEGPDVPCHGCKSCNTKKAATFEKKKHVLCNSCKLELNKYRKKLKEAKKN